MSAVLRPPFGCSRVDEHRNSQPQMFEVKRMYIRSGPLEHAHCPPVELFFGDPFPYSAFKNLFWIIPIRPSALRSSPLGLFCDENGRGLVGVAGNTNHSRLFPQPPWKSGLYSVQHLYLLRVARTQHFVWYISYTCIDTFYRGFCTLFRGCGKGLP
jgi:hypothetical protein